MNFIAQMQILLRKASTLEAENEKLRAELDRHRWIPVEEGLPEEAGAYQVLRENNQFPTTREFYFVNKTWTSRDVVTHWKPVILPDEKGSRDEF